VRWISAEPLLGPVNLRGVSGAQDDDEDVRIDALDGTYRFSPRDAEAPFGAKLDLVIAGCESGPGARPCDVAWLRSLRDQCAEARVPYFLKQAVQAPGPGGVNSGPPGIDRFADVIGFGPGSKRKAGGVIGLPYLDGRQHIDMPEVTRG
jgi:hypothetical protein